MLMLKKTKPRKTNKSKNKNIIQETSNEQRWHQQQ